MSNISTVLLFGKIPPPIGGVTVSVKNLILALKAKNVLVDLFGLNMTKVRYDLAHIHYSSLLKRLLGVILARIFARKVIFTVHGKFLDMDNFYNKYSVKLSDGVIVLNENLLSQLQIEMPDINCKLLPSIFEEGFSSESDSLPIFESRDQHRYLLVYASDRNYRDGHEVYGIEFVLQNIEKFPSNDKVVVLDVSGQYENKVAPFLDRIIYINQGVDFITLLKQIDIYLRPTYMDGASVAVQEALIMNVPVLASDVIDRPGDVVTYRYMNSNDFFSKLSGIDTSLKVTVNLQSIDKYLDFYDELSQKFKG